MFIRDDIGITFTAMHYPLSFAFLVCIILYIDDKQFRCSVFTFVQYMNAPEYPLWVHMSHDIEDTGGNFSCDLDLKDKVKCSKMYFK